MHKNKNFTHRYLPAFIASLSTLGLSSMAEAEIMLYDKDQTTFSTDGYINAFYVNSDVDRAGDQYDRRQARVKMGFLPNYLGFNMGKQVDDLKLGARASFWVTINDSETNGTDTAIDVRQFYGTVANPEWGEVLIGKDFGLFARSNILLDELLAGYGQVSDTLGLVDGGGVSFGNIGSGYPYPFPTSQITYRTPVMDGLRVGWGSWTRWTPTTAARRARPIRKTLAPRARSPTSSTSPGRRSTAGSTAATRLPTTPIPQCNP